MLRRPPLELSVWDAGSKGLGLGAEGLGALGFGVLGFRVRVQGSRVGGVGFNWLLVEGLNKSVCRPSQTPRRSTIGVAK